MDAKKAQELVDQVAEGVREAIDEAQRQAEKILVDAEAQAEKVRADAERLRGEAERVRADAEAEASRRLDDVQSALADLRGKLGGGATAEVEPGPVTVPEPEPPQTPEPTPDPMPEPGPAPVPEPMPEPTPEPMPPPETPATTAKTNGAEASSDDSGARLVAMKLALDGASREDARKQLADEFAVGDLDALLEDVYSKAGR